jgi:hypothetical protein
MTLGIVENDTEEFKLHHRGKEPGEVFQHAIQVCLRGNNVRGPSQRLIPGVLIYLSVIIFQDLATLL